jgi:uncharacterized ion transporter superfamily protein YfcC
MMRYIKITTHLLLILTISFLCSGCGPSSSDVKAIAARYASAQVGVPVQSNGGIRIENSFTQTVNGEKIYFYDFIFRVKKPDGSWSSWITQYRIALAKRGNSLELLQ